jgi:hypothetical protein
MGPLVNKHSEHPAWLAWKAHVAVASFVVHHSYDAASAPAEIDRLVEAFDLQFQQVEEWRGYEKPKMHPFSHLSTALREFGPWRCYWCFPWEGFLQLLKRAFEMTNYKSAAYTVGLFWAAKSVMHYRDAARISWYDDSIELASSRDSDFTALAQATRSKLVLACLQLPQPPLAIRRLQSVTRGADHVQLGDWVLLQQADITCITRVKEIVQAQIIRGELASFVIRMWCEGCTSPHFDECGGLWADKPDMGNATLVSLEEVHVSVVTRNEHSVYDTYKL